MITFAGIYLLVITTDITGTADQIGLLKQPDMAQCLTLRSSSFYRDPKYRRVECIEGAAILSESLVNATIDRLNGTLQSLDQLRRGFGQ